MENSWLNKKEYPFTSRYFPVNGQKLHYIDEGTGEILLFVHGEPSWSFEYRNLIKGLSNKYRCIAVDHIGFGLSDKPGRYDYSTPNHSATLRQFIIEKELQNITLIVHDFGGPIGLHLATEIPERFRRFVIFNSWLWSNEEDADLKKLRKIVALPFVPFLYRFLDFAPRVILPKSFGKKKLAKKILEQYIKPFADKATRGGPLAFLYSLLNDDEWFQKIWNKRDLITDKPILIIWGVSDPVIKPHQLQKFKTGFPNAKVIEFAESGHFPHEEEPERVLSEVQQWLI